MRSHMRSHRAGWLWWPQSCPNLAYRKCTQYTARPILIKNCSKQVIPSKGCEQCSTKFLGVKNVILCAVYSPVATSQYASGFWLSVQARRYPWGPGVRTLKPRSGSKDVPFGVWTIFGSQNQKNWNSGPWTALQSVNVILCAVYSPVATSRR